MRGFKPLSLCNVETKLVSKIIVNRLKETLKSLFSPCQTSFAPGQQGFDNALLCQEFLHSLIFTKAKRGAVVIRVNLEKPYEHME